MDRRTSAPERILSCMSVGLNPQYSPFYLLPLEAASWTPSRIATRIDGSWS